ncbi:MAG TPA: glycosyltransferase family 4 protein [Streptosporangiaceae bacterium]
MNYDAQFLPRRVARPVTAQAPDAVGQEPKHQDGSPASSARPTSIRPGSGMLPADLLAAAGTISPADDLPGLGRLPLYPDAADALAADPLPAGPLTADGLAAQAPVTDGVLAGVPGATTEPDRPGEAGLLGPPPGRSAGRHVLFVAWRDLASPRAGGSEVLVDNLARGVLARGDRATLLCGGPVAERPYRVIRNGGSYTQFARAPLAYRRQLTDADLVVEVCNGMPFFAPLWSRRPTLCLVNHVHTDLWRLRMPPPLSTAGRFTESVLMPRAHRGNLFLTVSPSTAEALQEIGVPAERIRQICNGVVQPDPLTPRSAEPMFLALGRLTDYKRIDLLLRLWERVRPVTGGTLVIAGDGPERGRIQALAGPGVVITGRVSEPEKHRLLCAAWMLLHPAMIEGWGIVIAEAAIRGTPAIGFNVPGLRDSVVDGETGTLVANDGQFASAWAALALDRRRREEMGHAARRRALQLHWSAAVEGFAAVADEAIERARAGQRAGAVRQP